ncbi:hypothetical protein GQ607_016375 [Colletotrichum asianum]|uniref:Uncharacterized protein n=1 Tax=Colletotrichum asianum TaxID=702518 RepID=A0A8H3VWS9_9PEZI|nr:hypothetical protein GQ607_016375 [Colletotrichum asianum]
MRISKSNVLRQRFSLAPAVNLCPRRPPRQCSAAKVSGLNELVCALVTHIDLILASSTFRKRSAASLRSSGLLLRPNTSHSTSLDTEIETTANHAILVQILRAATQIASASTSIACNGGTGQPDYLAFPLAHVDGFEHIRNVLHAHDLDDSKLHFEYYPNRDELRLKMPTTLHHQFAASIEAVVSRAARDVLGVDVRGFDRKVPIEGGTLYPAIGWNLSRLDPVLCSTIEVAFYQHTTSVAKKLQEQIMGSGGHVRAALGVKIDYCNANSYESIRQNLDRCFICL